MSGWGLLLGTPNFCIYLQGAAVQNVKYIPFVVNLS